MGAGERRDRLTSHGSVAIRGNRTGDGAIVQVGSLRRKSGGKNKQTQRIYSSVPTLCECNLMVLLPNLKCWCLLTIRTRTLVLMCIWRQVQSILRMTESRNLTD